MVDPNQPRAFWEAAQHAEVNHSLNMLDGLSSGKQVDGSKYGVNDQARAIVKYGSWHPRLN
jgi:hypothetical protein